MFLKDKLKVQHPWFSPSVLHLFRYYAVRDGARGVGELSNVLPTFDNLVSLWGQIVECLPAFDKFAVHRNKIVEYPAWIRRFRPYRYP